jgi:aspartyl-tRNA(Asn)/glutamyl-tRNA(Gln) amidotransferase subunit B
MHPAFRQLFHICRFKDQRKRSHWGVIAQGFLDLADVLGMLQRITDGTISGKIAKQVFEAMWAGEGDADAVIESKGLKQITDSGAIEAIVREVLDNNPKQIEQYKAGQEKLMGYFVGQVMKATQGKANPGEVNKILKQLLAG